MTVENYANQRQLAICATRSQERIVGQNRPHADANRVDFRANSLRVPVGGGRRQRGPTTGRLGNATVCADGRLQRHKRSSLVHERKEGLIEQNCRGATGPHVHFDPSRLEEGEASAAHERIRILDGCHDTRDAGFGNSRNTGTRATRVATGFKRAIQRGATRFKSGQRRGRSLRHAGARAREILLPRPRHRQTR
jgi:hypothetical protein